MQFVQAKIDHTDFISQSLSDYYSKANSFFGYPKYKEDKELLAKHVSKRIDHPDSGFVYLMAIEDDEPVGFINLMVDEYNIGSILVVIGNSKEIIRGLVDEGVVYLKSNDVKYIQSEIFSYENDLKEIFQEIGIEEKLINFKLKI